MIPAPVSVLVPTIPGRQDMLAEALRSVWAQTYPVAQVLVRGSQRAEDPAWAPVHLASQRNALLPSVDTEWVATLDDDDTWRPNHVEAAAWHFARADVVYSWPDPPWAITRLDCTDWDPLVLRARLRYSNFLPSAAFIRTEALRAVGGWQTKDYDGDVYASGATWEDWDLWIRLADAGARFVCTGVVTWDYRIDGEDHALHKGRTPA